MSEKRINTGITILPSVRHALAEQAAAEDKTFSRLLEVVAHWALNEMKTNRINSTTLKSWHVAPPDAPPTAVDLRKKPRRAPTRAN